MSPSMGVLIMMNNYLHDVATALLFACGGATWLMVKKLGDAPDKKTVDYFLRIYRGMTGLAKFSLVWIILGGIPRTIFYREFEWANAAGRNQVAALVIKHIVAFIFVGIGVVVWVKINKRVKKLKERI